MAAESVTTAPLGSDFAGVSDLDPDLTVVTGQRALVQALARGLLESPGSEPDDPTSGAGFGDLIGESSAGDESYIAHRAETQCLMDERVLSARVSVTADDEGSISLDVAAESAEGPFRFVIAPSELTIDILQLRG
jgi:hypothetical protein